MIWITIFQLLVEGFSFLYPKFNNPTNEIPMRQLSHLAKMNMWVFHQTIKNQIIY
jgi:hypothetical protein